MNSLTLNLLTGYFINCCSHTVINLICYVPNFKNCCSHSHLMTFTTSNREKIVKKYGCNLSHIICVCMLGVGALKCLQKYPKSLKFARAKVESLHRVMIESRSEEHSKKLCNESYNNMTFGNFFVVTWPPSMRFDGKKFSQVPLRK